MDGKSEMRAETFFLKLKILSQVPKKSQNSCFPDEKQIGEKSNPKRSLVCDGKDFFKRAWLKFSQFKVPTCQYE